MYKKQLIIAMALLAFCQSRALAQFSYVYPIPNSKYHMPDRIIILRASEPIDSTSLQPSLFSLVGSASGVHDFTVRLADDKRTINLWPTTYFAYSETVAVTVHPGLRTTSGNELDSLQFSFGVRNPPGLVNRPFKRDEFAEADNFSRGGHETPETDGLLNTGAYTILVNTNPDPGNVFFCNGNIIHLLNAQFVDIINNNGDSIFKINYHKYGTDFKLNLNRYMTIFNPDSLRYEMWDSSYHVIRSFKPYDNYTSDEHEFMIYPDGHYYMLGKDTLLLNIPIDSIIQPAIVVGAIVQKIDPHGNLITEWRSWDSVDVSEAQHISYIAPDVDYIHANSIEEDSDGNVLLSCRHLDQIIKINMENGVMMWRLGGVKNQFIFLNDTAKFSAQHDFRRLPNGHYTVFDNGNFHTPEQSFAKEYVLDQQHKIATLIWFYAHPYINSKPLLGTAMGSVQRLPHNHTLIDWGLLKSPIFPNMTEVDSLGNIVWELKFDDSTNAAYRVHRYDWSPCSRPTSYTLITDSIRATSASLKWTNGTNAQQYNLQIKGMNDTTWSVYSVKVPDTVIHVYNLIPDNLYQWKVASICDTLNDSTSGSGYTDTKMFATPFGTTNTFQPVLSSVMVYPNPASESINIVLTAKPMHTIQFELLSASGKTVLSGSFNNDKNSLQLQNIPSGMYLLKLYNQDMQCLQKISVEK